MGESSMWAADFPFGEMGLKMICSLSVGWEEGIEV